MEHAGTIWNPFLSQVIHERSCWPCTPIPQGVRAGHSGRTILLEIEDDMCWTCHEKRLICGMWSFHRKMTNLWNTVKAVKAIGVASDCQEAQADRRLFSAETVWQIPFLKRQKDSLVITVVGCGRLLIASRTLWGASSVRQWKHLFFSRLHLRVVAAFYTPVGWWTVWGL